MMVGRVPAAPTDLLREVRKPIGRWGIPREQLIMEAVYSYAEQRGFAPGNELSDWLDAEADVERMLEGGPAA